MLAWFIFIHIQIFHIQIFLHVIVSYIRWTYSLLRKTLNKAFEFCLMDGFVKMNIKETVQFGCTKSGIRQTHKKKRHRDWHKQGQSHFIVHFTSSVLPLVGLMRSPSKRLKAAHHTLVLAARLIGMKRNPFTYLGRGCQNASDKIRKGKRVCASPQASLSVKEFLTFLPAIALRRCKLNCYSEG